MKVASLRFSFRSFGRLCVALAFAACGVLVGSQSANAATIINVEYSLDGGAWTALPLPGGDGSTNASLTTPTTLGGVLKFSTLSILASDNPSELSSTTARLANLDSTAGHNILLAVATQFYTTPVAPPTIQVTSSVGGSYDTNHTPVLVFQSYIDQADRGDHTASGSLLTPGPQTPLMLVGSYNNMLRHT